MQLNIEVYETNFRRINVIETFWDDFPYYYEIKSPMYIKLGDSIKPVFKGEFIVWTRDKQMKVFTKGAWNKLYGAHFAEEVKRNAN